jgi:transketolase
VVVNGHDAVLFAYGPVMLNEALRAAEILGQQDLSLKVINHPWLNHIDEKWFEQQIADFSTVFVLDNHSKYGGLADQALNTAQKIDSVRSKRFIKFGLDEFPACGTPPEALAYHKLDGSSIAAEIKQTIM